MTEQWLIQDIKHLLQHRNRVVLLDPTNQCSFMLPILAENQVVVIQTDNRITEKWQQEKEELMLRHEAETNFKDKPIVFYVTRSQSKLSFLFDYCFTHGCLNLTHPQEWIKKKIFSTTGLQVHLDNPMLLTAAKLGIGKDIAWWKKIVQNLEEVINLDEELLPFVHNPDDYLKTKDADIRRLFEEKLHELLNQQYISKPPKTLAEEVVKRMFDGLSNNDISAPLLALYYQWVDSAIYRPSLEAYILNAKIKSTTNPWLAHPDHCFESIDMLALKQLVENLRDKSFVSEKLQLIRKRINSSKALPFVPKWWTDISILLNADISPLNNCNNLNTFIGFYTDSFSKLDRAIRNLYEAFIK